MSWLTRNMGKPEGVTEITPEVLDDRFKTFETAIAKAVDDKLATVFEKIGDAPAIKRINDYISGEEEAEKAARERAAAELAARTTPKFENVDAETRQFVQTQIAPIANAALLNAAMEQRRVIFEDAEQFPYYTGAVKAKIDEMLDKQPLDSRGNPEIIRNAYKLVVFDHQKDINDQKIKSRISNSVGSSSGTGGPNTGNADPVATLTPEMRTVAQKLGISDADYAAAQQELRRTGQYV